MTDTHAHTERQEINGNIHPTTQHVNSIVNTGLFRHGQCCVQMLWYNITVVLGFIRNIFALLEVHNNPGD